MPRKALRHCEFDSKDLLVKAEFSLPAEVAAIQPSVDRVMEIVKASGCANGHELDIEIALFEALANAIRHGCRNDATKMVECCVMCDESRGMLIVVRDPGPGFDPEKVESPLTAQNIYRHHGRGIYLINQLMDEVRFEKGGTEIHMRKHPPGTQRRSQGSGGGAPPRPR